MMQNWLCRRGLFWPSALLLLVLAIFFTGCQPRREAAERVIYVPVLADASWLLADGAFMKGVDLAVEELNEKYGPQGFVIKTAVIDDQASYELGVEKATELAGDPMVTAVLNLQNFDVTKTTADILARSGKPVIFPYGAYDSLFTRDNPYLFCGVPSFSDLGQAMAMYVLENDYERVAIYYNGLQSQDELVTAFELALLGSEVKVVDYISSIISKSHFNGIHTRWSALGVDVVLIAQYGLPEAFAVLDIIRGRDQKIAIIGEPIFNRANVLKEHSEIAEGMVISSTLVLEESNELFSFQERYRARCGEEADIWTVQGYDILRLVVDHAVMQSLDPRLLAEALHSEEGYQGIGRQIRFKPGGALVVDIGKIPMLTSRNGQFE